MVSTTLIAYGVYLIANGLLLFAVPSFALGLVGLDSANDPWIRVVGVLAIEIGFYFVIAARKRLWEFYSISVYARLGVGFAFVVLVSLGLAPWQLLIFAVVDTLSALSTRWYLGTPE